MMRAQPRSALKAMCPAHSQGGQRPECRSGAAIRRSLSSSGEQPPAPRNPDAGGREQREEDGLMLCCDERTVSALPESALICLLPRDSQGHDAGT